MKESILQQSKECLFCGTTVELEKHHVFGAANRAISDKYGLTVYLCHKHHNEPPAGVHFNKTLNEALKQYGQREFEKFYGHTAFMALFGKNYL